MKLLGLAVIVLIGVVVGFTQLNKFIKEEGQDTELIGVAFGEARDTDNTIQVHVPIRYTMTRPDPPIQKENGNFETWDEWLAVHFKVTDDMGQEVPLDRSDFSQVIKPADAGSPEFFLIVTLERGRNYTFHFQPLRFEPKVFTWDFTAPQEFQKMRRVNFRAQ